MAHLRRADYLSQSHVNSYQHISTSQYNLIFHEWIEKLGLDASLYSTHSMAQDLALSALQEDKEFAGDSATVGAQDT